MSPLKKASFFQSLCLPCEMFILLNAQPIQLGRNLFFWSQG
jgi:hypothetical protein